MIGREWGTGRDAKAEVWGGLEFNTGCLLSRDMIRPNKGLKFQLWGPKIQTQSVYLSRLVFSRMSEAFPQASEF